MNVWETPRVIKMMAKCKDKDMYRKLERFISSRAYYNKTFQYDEKRIFESLANLTKYVDYKCDFKDGGCKKYRKGHETCCCSGCSGSFGYIDHLRYDKNNELESAILYYIDRFDLETGFWRKGKGCILPREKRSKTCLSYKCSKVGDYENVLLRTIREFKGIDYNNDYYDSLLNILKEHFEYKDKLFDDSLFSGNYNNKFKTKI